MDGLYRNVFTGAGLIFNAARAAVRPLPAACLLPAYSQRAAGWSARKHPGAYSHYCNDPPSRPRIKMPPRWSSRVQRLLAAARRDVVSVSIVVSLWDGWTRRGDEQ